jgi:hypothetical protein
VSDEIKPILIVEVETPGALAVSVPEPAEPVDEPVDAPVDAPVAAPVLEVCALVDEVALFCDELHAHNRRAALAVRATRPRKRVI